MGRSAWLELRPRAAVGALPRPFLDRLLRAGLASLFDDHVGVLLECFDDGDESEPGVYGRPVCKVLSGACHILKEKRT